MLVNNIPRHYNGEKTLNKIANARKRTGTHNKNNLRVLF